MKHYNYWIALEQTKGIGPAHMKEIYEALKGPGLSITDLFSLSPAEMRAELGIRESVAEAVALAGGRLSALEEDYHMQLDAGVETVLFFEEAYPRRLLQVMRNAFPPILYLYGNRSIFAGKGAAIIGEKEVSAKGELIAYMAARELARHRIVTVSGLARGVDTIAHRSAIEHGGDTIAVLPYGFSRMALPDILKDAYNPDTFLMVSPFPFSREYSVYQAYQRNRIICALSFAAMIVEAPEKSGMIEAAKSAHELGTPLYVTEYASYPASAAANPSIMKEYGARPVRGRMMNDMLTPNLDHLIGVVKFAQG